MGERLLPYEIDYKILTKCRKAETLLLWIVAIISILNVIQELPDNVLLALQFLNYLTIILCYVLNVTTEIFLYPATAYKRRKGFIDNSLGTKYLEKEVEGYYSNDHVKKGLFKIIVNCGENCYFTWNIAKAMLPLLLFKNILCFFVFVVFAYIGFGDNSIFLSILQVLLSSLFLTELIYHISFVVKLHNLFERFKEAFGKSTKEKTLQSAILLLLEYETILAYNKAPLSDKVYNKLKNKLTNEWVEIKKRYEIL